MTLDELLRIANAAGGADSGMGTGAPSLPAGGPAPRPALKMPQAVSQPPSAPVPAYVSDASMGRPDFFERFAGAGNANPLLNPVSQVADLVGTLLRGGHSGYADLNRRQSIDSLQADLDAKARTANAAAAAQAKADADARRKANVTARIAALDDRIQPAMARRVALQKAAEVPGLDPAALAGYKREAANLDAQLKGWNRAKASILGIDALDDTATALPDRPFAEKPEKAPKEDQGSYVTVKTPDGPKLMRQSEAAAAGYVPTNIRETRTASPGEREQLVGDIGLLTQINRVREAYQPNYVGTVKGRLKGVQQATMGIPKAEASFRSNLAAIRNQILKLRSGGAVTDGEAQRMLEELPTVNDESAVFESKLDSFENTFRTLAETRRFNLSGLGVGLDGITPLPERYVKPDRPDPAAVPGSDFDPLSIPGARRIVPVKGHTRKVGGKNG